MSNPVRRGAFIALIVSFVCLGAALFAGAQAHHMRKAAAKTDRVVKTDAQWRKQLSPQVYEITRRAGTEPAFTGAYWNNHRSGTYVCADCGAVLFSSKTKFESGTGWPSFYQPIASGRVKNRVDNSLGETRTEVLCSRCDAHLGHVFDDGPRPTGLRYCMNSAALKFVPAR